MKQKSFRIYRTANEDKSLILFLQIFLIFLIVCGGIMFIYYGFAKKDRINVIFNETGEADYKVYLKENDYYNAEYLEEGMSYIASLIDNIELNFNYNLNSNIQSKLNYKYKIDAELIITERGQENKVLYSKPIVLKDEVEQFGDTSGLIDEKIIIKYDDYNAMVNNYKKEYGLSVSSKLVVKMHIDSIGNSTELDEDEFTSSNDLIVSIPLSEQTIEINFNHNTINNSKEIVKYSSFNPINYIYLFVGLTIIIYGIVSVFKLFFRKKKKSCDQLYEKKRNDILKEYDRFIVEASEMKKNQSGKNIVKVSGFDELLDAREGNDSSIIFYEDVNSKKSVFTVIDVNNIFIYEFSIRDFNNK